MLSRSQKTLSLLVALGGIVSGMAIFAGPAMAFSLNPDAGSPGISEINEFHTIIFIAILVAIVAVNLAILRAARPRRRHVPSTGRPPGSPGIERRSSILMAVAALVVLAVAFALFNPIALVLVLVLIALGSLYALRAIRSREGGAEPTEESAEKERRLVVGLVLGALAVALFVTATVYSDGAREVPVSNETVAGLNDEKQLDIRATGQQWLWRFEYPNSAFSYHRLVVPAGVTVALRLDSIDVIHGWNVPSLTGKADAVPGQSNRVYFRADDEGVYGGRSSILSGQGYDTMAAEVEVVSPSEYEAFVENLKTDIQDAQDSVEKTIASSNAG